jgi:seryl-tRNA synthetase
MLEPRKLAEDREEIAASCRARGVSVDLDAAIAAQERWAAAVTELNEVNRQRGEHRDGGKAKLAGDEREAHVAEGRRLKQEVAQHEARVAEAVAARDEILQRIPNLVHPEAPVGGESDFRELRRVGEPTAPEFPVRDHLAIGADLDLFDFESAAAVSGQKFYYLKNAAVLLEIALQRYALQVLSDRGFTLYATPDLARRSVVDALAFAPRGPETQIYSVADTDLDLIGTAEITLGGLFADRILDPEELPIKVAGVSHCFRTEAGSAGRESRGLYRVHQFSKVEMFTVTAADASEAMLDHLLAIQEEILVGLEIPYRVIDVATGDLGAPAQRKFDVEAWMPGRGDGGDYGEVTSASNCTDYQARRLRTRIRGQKRDRPLAHTQNGTAVAVPRAIIAILENHQRADGTVGVPKALQPWMGCDHIGRP